MIIVRLAGDCCGVVDKICSVNCTLMANFYMILRSTVSQVHRKSAGKFCSGLSNLMDIEGRSCTLRLYRDICI